MRTRRLTPSWPWDVSWSTMWSKKQMPVPMTPRLPKFSIVASATTSLDAQLTIVFGQRAAARRVAREAVTSMQAFKPVSYTHLTLPTKA